MKRLAVQKVRNLEPGVRAWLTRLLGGVLPDDGEIHIELRQPGEPPPVARQPDDEMRRIMNAMSDLSGPPADELKAAMDDALKSDQPRSRR